MASTKILRLFISIIFLGLPPGNFSAPFDQSLIPNMLLRNILPILQTNPRNYIVWLHSSTSQLKWDLEDSISFKDIRLLTYFSYPNGWEILDYFKGFRFTQPYNVIISTYSIGGSNYVFPNLEAYLLRTRTVLFLFAYQDKTLTPTVSIPDFLTIQEYFPAIKLVLSDIRMIGGTPDLYFSLISAGYHSHNSIVSVSSASFSLILQNPPKQHKLYFRDANGRHMFALIKTRYKELYAVFLRAGMRYLCITWVSNTIAMSSCDDALMSVLYMAQAHNISFTIHADGIKKETATFRNNMESQFVESYYEVTYTEPRYFITGLRFVKSANLKVFYCQQNSSEKSLFHLDIWTGAFTLHLWGTLLALIFSSAVILVRLELPKVTANLVLGESLNLSRMFFNQSVDMMRNTRYIYLAIFYVALLFNRLYSESIKSTIIVKLPTKGYQTLNVLLNDGYQILWYNLGRYVQFTPESEYGDIFKEKGISQNIYDAFLKTELSNSFVNTAVFLQSKVSHLISDVNSGFFSPFLYKLIKENTRKIGKKVLCQFVEEPVKNSFLFWIIYSVNRDWLMETAERICQSGLREQVLRWADWAWSLQSKTSDIFHERPNDPVMQNDFIGLEKLISLLITLGLGSVSAMLVFIWERKFFRAFQLPH